MNPPKEKLSRRSVFAGAGALGALAAGAGLLRPAPVPQPAQQLLQAPPANGGGYILSEHVQRYYKSTKV